MVRDDPLLHAADALGLLLAEVGEFRHRLADGLLVAGDAVRRVLPRDDPLGAEREVVAHERARAAAPLERQALVERRADADRQADAVHETAREGQRPEEAGVVTREPELHALDLVACVRERIEGVGEHRPVGDGHPAPFGLRARHGVEFVARDFAGSAVEHQAGLRHTTHSLSGGMKDRCAGSDVEPARRTVRGR
jgi:hypothetical protein